MHLLRLYHAGLVSSMLWMSLFLGPTAPLEAQTPDDFSTLNKKIDKLQENQEQIQKELDEIRKLLTPAERPMPSSVNLIRDDTPFRGDKSAKVILIEYFDYQCPFCAGFFNDTMPQVLTDYILKGKVKYIVRDFPLEGAHPNALRAAEAAHCANDEGKFWPMHDELMGNADALDRPKLSLYAQDVGLDMATFDKCVDSGKYESEIRETMAGGSSLGVEGTPTFFLGVVDASGQRVVSLQRLEGAIPYLRLKEAIDKLLIEQETPTATAASH